MWWCLSYHIRKVSTLNVEVLELKKENRNTTIILELLLIALCTYFVLCSFHLAKADNLLDLFDSYAFRGSLKTIDKFNWVGKLMSYIISVFSMLGLFLICYQRLISLLYLAGRNTFDTVHEIKSSLSGGSGRDAFGIRSMFTNAMQGGGQYGTGLDAIVGFLLSLLPDVKKYSDYNPERMAYNVQEEDSCTTYMLKTAIPTIMLIFFFAMGYNGTLWQGFGVIVDAMGTAAEAVLKYFSQNNVDSKNPKTFVNTRRMKYADIIDIVADLATTKSYSAEQRALCAVIRSRCSTFFVTEGRYSKAFRNEITVAEVLRKPLVIYSFNKNADVMLDTMDTLRVFMVQYLDTKKQSIRKEQKLHTAAFYEELQRSNQFGKLVETISHSVTGSRSNNVMIFLLLNAVSVFNNNELNAIKSNITTKIVGKLEDGDIDLLVKEYGCKPIQKQLEKINDKSTNRWQNCFAILYDTGVDVDKAIYRTVVPQYMLEQFKTRDYNENIK